MLLPSANGKRLGVVEIGSRGIRLLVADFLTSGVVLPVSTQTVDLSLSGINTKSPSETRKLLDEMCRAVKQLKAHARTIGAVWVSAFGTESIRNLSQDARYDNDPLFAEIDVLPPREEALCSFIAAVMGCRKQIVGQHNALVIDQGGGSVEIAVGRTVPKIVVSDFASLPLGGNLFARMLSASRCDLKQFRATLNPLMDSYRLPAGPVDITIAQGSVATKCAWLTKRRGARDKYSPTRVHGTLISTDSISQFISAVEEQPLSSWPQLRAHVSPHQPESDDFDRTVAGAIPLLMLLEKYEQKEFVVSAHGTRFGVAWRNLEFAS